MDVTFPVPVPSVVAAKDSLDDFLNGGISSRPSAIPSSLPLPVPFAASGLLSSEPGPVTASVPAQTVSDLATTPTAPLGLIPAPALSAPPAAPSLTGAKKRKAGITAKLAVTPPAPRMLTPNPGRIESGLPSSLQDSPTASELEEAAAVARSRGDVSTGVVPCTPTQRPQGMSSIGVSFITKSSRWMAGRWVRTVMRYAAPAAYDTKVEACIAHDRMLLRGGGVVPALTPQEARDMGLNFDLGVHNDAEVRELLQGTTERTAFSTFRNRKSGGNLGGAAKRAQRKRRATEAALVGVKTRTSERERPMDPIDEGESSDLDAEDMIPEKLVLQPAVPLGAGAVTAAAVAPMPSRPRAIIPPLKTRARKFEVSFIPANKETIGISFFASCSRWKVQRNVRGKLVYPSPQFYNTKEEAALIHDLFLLGGARQSPPLTAQEARNMGLNFDLGVHNDVRVAALLEGTDPELAFSTYGNRGGTNNPMAVPPRTRPSHPRAVAARRSMGSDSEGEGEGYEDGEGYGAYSSEAMSAGIHHPQALSAAQAPLLAPLLAAQLAGVATIPQLDGSTIALIPVPGGVLPVVIGGAAAAAAGLHTSQATAFGALSLAGLAATPGGLGGAAPLGASSFTQFGAGNQGTTTLANGPNVPCPVSSSEPVSGAPTPPATESS